mmetsp:Transcript_29852/g.95505  ORF Transcript_29852/g.95505 Transcript_29852/m.95505 type:complete len:114 (-) Transcript_29852:87-428(-)
MPQLRAALLDEGAAAPEGSAEAVARFASGEARALVCTAAAARGLDFPRVRHVLLFDMPKDVAGFVHSAGRTARRGKEGLVTCLVESGAEVGRFRQLHALLPARALEFSGAPAS